MILVPQSEMHPLVLGLDVPGGACRRIDLGVEMCHSGSVCWPFSSRNLMAADAIRTTRTYCEITRCLKMPNYPSCFNSVLKVICASAALPSTYAFTRDIPPKFSACELLAIILGIVYLDQFLNA
jgi:hypothetical protein